MWVRVRTESEDEFVNLEHASNILIFERKDLDGVEVVFEGNEWRSDFLIQAKPAEKNAC